MYILYKIPRTDLFAFWWPMSSFLVFSVTVAVTALGIWIWIRRLRDRIPGGPRAWPLLGSTLELTANFHRLYDWITDYAMETPTFEASHMGFRFLFTVDPANVEHMLKTNFHNHVKGIATYEIQYDFLGDGILCGESSANLPDWSFRPRCCGFTV